MKELQLMQDKSPELSVALDAVRHAEAIVMAYFDKTIEVKDKADASPVTQADVEAERAIANTIRARFPNHRIVGEELGDTRSASEFAWIIDPIDGTKNFIRGIPFFGIEIALTRHGEAIIGVSSLPALGERLYAERGRGAFLDGREEELRVSSVSHLRDAHVSLGGLNHFQQVGQAANVLRITSAVARVRAFGDAYAYHLLATGKCEAVLEMNIKLWDVAALSVIVREAGGSCTELSGSPLNENTRSVLFSNGLVHEELLALYHQDVEQKGKCR
jgi:histidinol-phosphatase